MGDRIVIWEYENREGIKSLYFINNSTQVDGESFWYKDQKKTQYIKTKIPDKQRGQKKLEKIRPYVVAGKGEERGKKRFTK